MKLKLIFCILLVLATSVLIISSCTKDKTPRPPEPCDPNKIYFERDIKPLLTSNCAMSGCHDAATQQDGVNLSTYEGVRSQVRPGNPQGSELIQVINETDPDDRMPPPPKTALSQAQKDLLSNWILQGADNVICQESSASCSPSNVGFAADIQTILNSNCIGCHSGSTISGGVNLSTHAGVQSVAQSGKLLNAVSQNGQATPMPPNGKLSPCNVQKIKVWIEEGSKNN